MTTNPTPTDDAGIAARLDQLVVQLDALHKTLEAENVKRDQRIRINRRTTRVAIAVAIFGVVVGGFGVLEVRRSNDRTQEARRAACLQYNTQQRQAIDSEIEQSHDLVTAFNSVATRPFPQDVVDAYHKKHDDLIRMGHPLRDCSPAGIKKYLSRQVTR